MNNKKNYSDVKFTARELIAILNVLKHSKQFGQSVAPEDTIHEIIQKIQNSAHTFREITDTYVKSLPEADISDEG